MTRRALLLALIALLPACTTWPEDGRGGFAERRPVADPALQALVERFENQRHRGAERFAAGLADEAKTLLVRAQRNHHAAIFDDFAVDLAHLQMLLDRIERQIAGH
jgi:hypothetical protein